MAEQESNRLQEMQQEIDELRALLAETLKASKGKTIAESSQQDAGNQGPTIENPPPCPPSFTPHIAQLTFPLANPHQSTHYTTNPTHRFEGPSQNPSFSNPNLTFQGKNSNDLIYIPEFEQGEKVTDELLSKGKLESLEERLRAIEGVDAFGNVDAAQLCLVPGVVIPPKFKVPEFEKYSGISCPRSHLIMYCRKMTAHVHDDKLLIHFFQDSLTGPAARWYVHLDGARIHNWKDLADLFLKQYKHNLDMAPDRMDLQRMEKRGNENFKEYAQRWREVAAQIQPPLTDKEMAVMFLNTLKSPFYDKMIGNGSTNFSDIITIGERIEYGVKSGRIADMSKNFNLKRKEEEVHEVSSTQRFQYNKSMRYVQNNTPRNSHPPIPHQASRQVINDRNQRGNYKKRTFDPIPITYSELLPQLLQNGQLVPIPLQPLRPPYPKWYNPNERCDYHAGALGHSTENCISLKSRVQGLVKAGWIKFD